MSTDPRDDEQTKDHKAEADRVNDPEPEQPQAEPPDFQYPADAVQSSLEAAAARQKQLESNNS